MRKKSEILARLAELEEVSPEGTEDLFSALRNAIESYFTGGSELSEEMKETIHHVAMDFWDRKTKFEHQELVPPFPSSGFPRGYDDVTVIFDGGGTWEEMFTTDLDTFPSTFVQEVPEEGGGDGGEGGGELVWKNPIMEDWTARVIASKANAVSAVKALGDFCGNGSLNYGIAQIFEELGNRTEMPDKQETADRVYISGGFKAVIDEFGLDVLVPSYLK